MQPYAASSIFRLVLLSNKKWNNYQELSEKYQVDKQLLVETIIQLCTFAHYSTAHIPPNIIWLVIKETLPFIIVCLPYKH